ncbi:hypothetical protein TrVE_jg3657 [Triparma verrucosa]|uniref:Ion transport domain-containing protein n=1 Tax=Triparma verrucosa TaxID=1606542 RepID=A0A9W7BXT0_9STRA|nr:hypothetical protein TrVE_jg3657 [Triparma verrucosa]
MATPEEEGSNADEELNQMLHDLGTTATLFESVVTKWPRKGVGFSTQRYLVLTIEPSQAVLLSYYRDEFAFSSYQPAMDTVPLNSQTAVELINVPMRRKICIKVGKLGADDFLLFSVPEESLCKAWEGELRRAVGYIKKRKSSTANKNDQQEEDALIGGDGMSDRTLETASETVSDKTDEETQRMMDEMDEMTLDEMNRMAELEEEQGKRGLQMTEIKVSADQSKLSEVDEEREHDVKEGKKLKADIAQAEEEIKKGDPLTRRRAKKRKALLLKKCRVRKNLFNLVTKWFLTYHGRQGNLPVIKRLVEKMGRRAEDEGSADAAVPHHLGGHHKPLLDAVFVNVARSAARFKHKKLLTWLIKDWGVDINAQNVMGFPLITFAISSYGNDDGGEMLRYMHEDLGADVTILNDFGQNALFFAVANYKNCISYIDYFVDVCELDPKNVDKFNCSLLHWATLHGNLEAIKYIYERDWQVHSRAHWGKLVDMYLGVGFLPPEVAQARNGWRSRGLLKYANSASPLGVAILHNNGKIAKYLMGLGSTNMQCQKRQQIFADSCADLEMVALTWPDLLPDVLDSFQIDLTASESDSNISAYSRDLAKSAGGFKEELYDIADVLGDPSQPTARTPLAILARTNSPEVFDSPIVKLIIALKWETFGRRTYLRYKTPYVLLFISFWVGFMLDNEGSRWASYVLSLYCLVAEEFVELYNEGVHEYLTSVWNYMAFPAYVGILYSGLYYDILDAVNVDHDQDQREDSFTKIVLSFAAFCLILRCLEFLSILQTTSLFVVTVRLLILDIATWATLFILFIFAFASAFRLLIPENEGFASNKESYITVFRMSIGDFDYPFSEDEAMDSCATALWIFYTFLVHLLYLNVLIAMMSKSFETVESAAGGMSSLALAKSLVTWEGTMPAFKRKAYYEQLIPEKNSLKGNRAIRLQLQSGLGLDVVGKIRAMCSYLLGASSADSASEGERTQVVIDAGRCTVYAKSEKTWKQLELEEIEEKERERERKMVELRGMMTGMSEEVSQVKEMMVNKFGEGEEDVGDRATEGGSLEEALRGGREKKGKRAKFMKFMAGK